MLKPKLSLVLSPILVLPLVTVACNQDLNFEAVTLNQNLNNLVLREAKYFNNVDELVTSLEKNDHFKKQLISDLNSDQYQLKFIKSSSVNNQLELKFTLADHYRFKDQQKSKKLAIKNLVFNKISHIADVDLSIQNNPLNTYPISDLTKDRLEAHLNAHHQEIFINTTSDTRIVIRALEKDRTNNFIKVDLAYWAASLGINSQRLVPLKPLKFINVSSLLNNFNPHAHEVKADDFEKINPATNSSAAAKEPASNAEPNPEPNSEPNPEPSVIKSEPSSETETSKTNSSSLENVASATNFTKAKLKKVYYDVDNTNLKKPLSLVTESEIKIHLKKVAFSLISFYSEKMELSFANFKKENELNRLTIDLKLHDQKHSKNLGTLHLYNFETTKSEIKENLDSVTNIARVNPESVLKTYAIATKDPNSQKLNVGNGAASGTTPGLNISPNPPLQRNRIPESYMQQAQMTYALSFKKWGAFEAGSGTGWILDYKLSDDNTYPVTWYIATNAHVIDNLSIKDEYYPWLFNPKNIDEGANEDGQSVLSMTTINPKVIKKDEEFGSTFEGWNYHNAYIEASKIKPIFVATDFLKSSPTDFIKEDNSRHFYYTDEKDNIKKAREEFADFAVFEVTFSSPQEAQKMTNDYYNWEEKNKFHFSEVNPYSAAFQKTKFKSLGFVPSRYSKAYKDIHINVPKNNYDPLVKGQAIGSSKWYQIFENLKGVTDNLLSFYFVGYRFDRSGQGTPHIHSGLVFTDDYGHTESGTSGSAVFDEEQNLIGIYFAADDTASLGIIQALWSPGFDYHGAFGDYRLAKYNLIYTNSKEQKKSYLSDLFKRYGKNYRTRLSVKYGDLMFKE